MIQMLVFFLYIHSNSLIVQLSAAVHCIYTLSSSSDKPNNAGQCKKEACNITNIQRTTLNSSKIESSNRRIYHFIKAYRTANRRINHGTVLPNRTVLFPIYENCTEPHRRKVLVVWRHYKSYRSILLEHRTKLHDFQFPKTATLVCVLDNTRSVCSTRRNRARFGSSSWRNTSCLSTALRDRDTTFFAFQSAEKKRMSYTLPALS